MAAHPIREHGENLPLERHAVNAYYLENETFFAHPACRHNARDAVSHWAQLPTGYGGHPRI